MENKSKNNKMNPEVNKDLDFDVKQKNKRSSVATAKPKKVSGKMMARKPSKAKRPAKKKTSSKRKMIAFKASKNPRNLKVSSGLRKKARSIIRQKAHKSSSRSIKIRSFPRNYVRNSRGRYAEKGRSAESDKFLVIYIYVPIQQAHNGKTAEALNVTNKK